MKQKLADVSRQKYWGWTPNTSLEDGLAKTYEFYLSGENHDLQISLSDVLVDNDELTALHRVIGQISFQWAQKSYNLKKILLNILAQSLL